MSGLVDEEALEKVWLNGGKAEYHGEFARTNEAMGLLDAVKIAKQALSNYKGK